MKQHSQFINEIGKRYTMGIKGLTLIIQENAPDAIKKVDIKNQFGRKIAIVSIQLVSCVNSLSLIAFLYLGCVSIPDNTPTGKIFADSACGVQLDEHI